MLSKLQVQIPQNPNQLVLSKNSACKLCLRTFAATAGQATSWSAVPLLNCCCKVVQTCQDPVCQAVP